MANWSCGEMQLVLPTKNVDKFLDYASDERSPYFYQSSFALQDREDNSHGLTKLTFDVQCTWSASSCLLAHDADAEDCLSLEGVCRELEVRRLAAAFEERGMMFAERITYDQENGIAYESYDLCDQAYVELDDDEEYIEGSATNNDTEEEAETAEPSVTLDDLIQGVPV